VYTEKFFQFRGQALRLEVKREAADRARAHRHGAPSDARFAAARGEVEEAHIAALEPAGDEKLGAPEFVAVGDTVQTEALRERAEIGGGAAALYGGLPHGDADDDEDHEQEPERRWIVGGEHAGRKAGAAQRSDEFCVWMSDWAARMSDWAARMSDWAARMSDWAARMSDWAARMSDWAAATVGRALAQNCQRGNDLSCEY
jgi:hypothetical protein